MTRVAFLGTPGAAVPPLHAIAASHEVAVVITQPDRPRGRSKTPLPPPVKVEAERLGLVVQQPVDAAELRAALETVDDLDLGVVVAYGRLIRPEALEVPAHGMLNAHFSLLPRWRGAAPVARALLAGDTMTGVTVIALDEGLDTGPVLTAQAVDIGAEETAGELTERLAALGGRLLTGVIPGYLNGQVVPAEQSDEGMTYADKLEASDRPLNVNGPALDAVNRVRALSPEPGATLVIDGVELQVLRAHRDEDAPEPGTWDGTSGRVVAGFGDGGVELVEIKPPGKGVMAGSDWLRGRRRSSGVIGQGGSAPVV
jgi:methionyl-tRNA formyltransferase